MGNAGSHLATEEGVQFREGKKLIFHHEKVSHMEQEKGDIGVVVQIIIEPDERDQ